MSDLFPLCHRCRLGQNSQHICLKKLMTALCLVNFPIALSFISFWTWPNLGKKPLKNALEATNAKPFSVTHGCDPNFIKDLNQQHSMLILNLDCRPH